MKQKNRNEDTEDIEKEEDGGIIDLDNTGQWESFESITEMESSVESLESVVEIEPSVESLEAATEIEFSAENYESEGRKREEVSEKGITGESRTEEGVERESLLGKEPAEESVKEEMFIERKRKEEDGFQRVNTFDEEEMLDEEDIEILTEDGEEGEEELETELEYLSMEEDEYEEEEEDSPFAFFERVQTSLGLWTLMDKVVALTAFIILLVGIVTVAAFGHDMKQKKQMEVMVPIGEELEKVAVLGSDKILAVADVAKAKEEAARQEEELLKQQEEEAAKEENAIEVVMKITSMQKDLKIKFVNGENGKLVKDIPFEVSITDPAEKKYNYIDEDKDGIIYLTKLEAGQYTVSMVEIKDLEGYTFKTEKQKIKVRETIAYEKVDVSGEIKDQSEVNMAQEDTAKKEETQAVLQDTVEWVESRKEEYDATETYAPIDKNEITDPSLSASLKLDTSILKYITGETAVEGTLQTVNIRNSNLNIMTETEGSEENSSESSEPASEEQQGNGSTGNGGNEQVPPSEEGSTESQPDGAGSNENNQPENDEGSKQPSAPVVISVTLTDAQVTLSEGTPTKQLTALVEAEEGASYEVRWDSSDHSLVTVDSQGVLTLVAVPEEDRSCNVVAIAGDKTAMCTVIVKGKKQEEAILPASIAISETSLKLEVGASASLTAVIKPDNAANKGVTWSTSDGQVVKVEKGNVTAVGAGTAVITVTSKAVPEIKAECTVTVTQKRTITLDKTNVTLKVGESITLNAAVTPEGQAVSWASSNPEIASVNNNGKVKALKEGEVTITATSGKKNASCTVKVSNAYDPKKDTEKVLKDKRGNVVYIKSGDTYVEAKVADYYKVSEFYKKEKKASYRYYGWQNLDGKTYYFDKNGEKITGQHVIQGARYTFNSDGSLQVGSGILGIDVSTWNGNINWQQVKNSGVSYAIIRTGFRGSTQGALVEDNKFRQNIKGALDAGIKVGVYFFTQAVNEAEAVEEASMVLSQIKGYNITYPVFIDVESSGGRADGLDAGTRTRVINAFCQTIQNGGYRAGIYANKTWFEQKMNISALSGYKIWLAQYNTQVTYGGRYDMWQYSSSGTVSGISGRVDMNLSYMTY